MKLDTSKLGILNHNREMDFQQRSRATTFEGFAISMNNEIRWTLENGQAHRRSVIFMSSSDAETQVPQEHIAGSGDGIYDWIAMQTINWKAENPIQSRQLTRIRLSKMCCY